MVVLGKLRFTSVPDCDYYEFDERRNVSYSDYKTIVINAIP